MKKLTVNIISVLLLTSSCFIGNVKADLIPIHFTLFGDASDWPWLGRDYAGSGISGILYGLDENGLNQVPDSIEFTSDVSALGMTSNIVTSLGPANGSGFDIINGEVIDVTLLHNFNDPGAGVMQISFNYESANVLHWNGGSGPVLGMGNQDGFSGASYSSTVVPLPAAAWLFGSGMIAMIRLGRRQRS